MATYIHELADWPSLTWNQEKLSELLAAVRHRQGRLIGRMESLGFNLRREAVLETLTEDVLKSSEIEGEFLDKEQVRSSVARRLGVDIGAVAPVDRNVDGVVEMMLDATQKYGEVLNEERLFGWHSALFPYGRSERSKIVVGAWRDDALGPMQVVSGAMNNPKVHFEAPAASRLNVEIQKFLDWFESKDAFDLVLKAGVAHFWFVTIHPFDDGNGRIARAIGDMMLARSEGSSQRFYSMSAQIQKDRDEYYNILEISQKRTLDVTGWLEWFLGCLDRAIVGAEETLAAVLRKARFWDELACEFLNPRQKIMINRLINGFEGKLTSTKWASIAKCSQDTALRDITELVDRGILIKDEAGGRSTSYYLIEK